MSREKHRTGPNNGILTVLLRCKLSSLLTANNVGVTESPTAQLWNYREVDMRRGDINDKRFGMTGDEKGERDKKPIVFIVMPVAEETISHTEPMTEEGVRKSLEGYENYEKIGMVDELLPDLGERGFGSFKYHPTNGRMEQEQAIIDVKLGDSGSEGTMNKLLHWIQCHGTGNLEKHLATISIDPAADLLVVKVGDKVTLCLPLILVKAMLNEHEQLEKIRLAKAIGQDHFH